MRTHTVWRRVSSIAVLALVGLSFVIGTAGPAGAQADNPDDDDQIVLHGTLVVPAGEEVGTAVILDGPATIDGTVKDALVVLNGDVDISGEVGKDVVALNGDVVVHEGAHIGGNLTSTKDPTVEDGAQVDGDISSVKWKFEWDEVGIASRITWWVMFSGSTLILGLIMLLAGPALDGALDRVGRSRMGGAVGIGVGWFFLLPIVSVILLVTFVGTPLGLYALLALAFIYTVGYVAGAIGIGRRLVRPPTSRYVSFLAGWGLLRLIALIPVVGGIAFVVVAVLGFGLLAVAARRRGAGADDMAMAPPPPAPPMPA